MTITGLLLPDISESFAESEKIKKKDRTMMIQPDLGMKMVERDGVLEFDISEINEFLLDTGGQGVTCTADNGESKICKEGCIASTDTVTCLKVDKPQGSN